MRAIKTLLPAGENSSDLFLFYCDEHKFILLPISRDENPISTGVGCNLQIC